MDWEAIKMKPEIISLATTNEFTTALWVGNADGSNLQPGIDLNLFKNKFIVFKDISFALYRSITGKIVTENTTNGDVYNTLLIGSSRIDEGFEEDYRYGIKPIIKINNTVLSFFNTGSSPGFSFKNKYENLNIIYPGKVNNINVSVEASYNSDNNAITTQTPVVKVMMNLYLIDSFRRLKEIF